MRVPERDVIEKLGIGLKVSRELRRNLKEGDHWVVVNGIGVMFTEEGVAALTQLVFQKKDGADQSPDQVVSGAPEVKPVEHVVQELLVEKKKEVELTCSRCDFRNRKVVEALAGSRRVLVRVRDAGLYVPGMAFEATLVSGELFEEVRAPRLRGVG